MSYFRNFDEAIRTCLRHVLLYGAEVDPGRWQGIPTEGKPDLVTKEIIGVDLQVPVSRTEEELMGRNLFEVLLEEIQPNLSWADEHFQERVGGEPMNPDPSHVRWPWWTPGAEVTKGYSARDVQEIERQFTHTYSERFWPKLANGGKPFTYDGVKVPHDGIRFPYGDLGDVVNLLFRDPQTRQAYLPIFFPEDTGAVHGGRVPCTLGYHFLLRHDMLHIWYFIRSCDLVRHFRDDIYFAVKLLLWVIAELQEKELRSDSEQVWVDVTPGIFHMNIASLHYHKGDEHHVRQG